ncbi:metallophosphoesterase family protein [Rhodocaloribacter sp.]
MIRLLCTGDLHLGRFPARVPDDASLSVAGVWLDTVDSARERRVDAVLLTGDVVDASNKFFEAYGALRRGLERLAEAGIPVFAVAGNHDFDVLGNLADTLPDTFTLLGRDGTWGTTWLPREGTPVLRLLGWSFPASHVNTSPLETLALEPAEVPTLGLLHTDLDQTQSRYAPVTRQALNDIDVAAWLLGHIHKPTRYPHRDGFLLYPGSLQPLDPGETGQHGPWLLEVYPSGQVTAEQLPLATLRYRERDLDVGGIDTREDLERHVTITLEEDLRGLVEAQPSLSHVVYRLRLTGHTSLHRDLPGLASRIEEDLSVPSGNVTGVVDRVFVHTRPEISLDRLTGRQDMMGFLARLLQSLEGNDTPAPPPDDLAPLLRKVHDEARRLASANAYAPLRQERSLQPPSESDLRRLLREQGWLLLAELLTQQPIDP